MSFIDQFSSVIQWDQPSSTEIFVKYTTKGDEIKNKSSIILQPGQGCVLTYEGEVKGYFDEAGKYEIDSDNKPFITTIKKYLSLQDGSEHKVGVWFYRKADILNMRWGTKVPISYVDPVYTFPILLSAFGNYSIKITDAQYFFENIIAGEETYTTYDLKEILLSRIGQPITDYLANSKFSYVEIDSNLNAIAQETKLRTESVFKDLGFEVLDFRIEGSQFDSETLDRIATISDTQAEVQQAKLAGLDYVQMQQVKAMRDAANNQGGGAGVGMGLGAGMQMGNLMTQGFNAQASTSPEPITDTPLEKMKKLKEMFELELITEEEYAAKKQAILEVM